ncbi:DUF2218 domain-containing protein [Rhizobium sp. KVB221]|uniref:DUF2218 domain-containing protein n=1 Tax=Rhizobium setariae TaxID=2801340 RepID=A0A937CRB0_9HYPH|nr:DUF2218 domain-containing protein [Rhizobium setariae]MBL0374242.1 DUF2218 domain-containing protein [Rhizobium setariae]
MAASQALFITDNASKYLQQLCKHWSHRFTVDFTAESGWVDFGGGERMEAVADRDGLRLVAYVQSAESSLAELETVIGDHLARFAFREEVRLTWQPLESGK